MSFTRRGVIAEINEINRGIKVRELPDRITLSGYDDYLANYISTAGHNTFRPEVAAVRKALAILSATATFAASNVDARPRAYYMLATQDRPQKIEQKTLLHVPASTNTKSMGITKQIAIDTLANHSLVLASNESSSRRKIPENYQKRVDALKDHTPAIFASAISSALKNAADIMASVSEFEKINGITESSNNLGCYAIHASTPEGFVRVSGIGYLAEL